MSDIQIFENPEFGKVRTVDVNGEPWLVGKDIAEALGYERPTKAVQDHVDAEDKDEIPIRDSIGRMQNTPVINESGLYSLVLSSKLPGAKKFKRWVTCEVLPSIRKNGGYIHGQETMSDTELIAKALLMSQKIIDEKQKVIERMAPKEIFADAVAASDSSILVGELAKILKQNGVNIGQNRLFDWLREHGYLIKYGSSYNMPTQRSMELGLMRIKETAVTHSDGHVSVNKTVKITGRGQEYFINLFMKKEA